MVSNLLNWFSSKSNYIQLINDSSNSNLNNIQKRTKKLKVILFISVGMIPFIILFGVILTTTDLIYAFPTTNDKKNSSCNSVRQPRIGIIQETTDHELRYDTNARVASKQFYELLSDFNNSYYDTVSMTLGTDFFSDHVYSRQPYVANGYIGSRIPNIGLGYALDNINLFTNISGSLNQGWPERNRRYAGSFVSDFYALEEHLTNTNYPEIDDIGYPNIISSIPEWTDLQFFVANSSKWFNTLNVTADQVTNYSQNLSMANGIVSTEMDWLNGQFHVHSNVFAHRDNYPVGVVSLEISLNIQNLPEDFTDVEIDIHDILNFNTSHRTYLKSLGYDDKTKGIFMEVEPDNVPYSNAALFSTAEVNLLSSNSSTSDIGSFVNGTTSYNNGYVSQIAKISLTKNTPKVVIRKYVGVMSSSYSLSETGNLKKATSYALDYKGNYDYLLLTHKLAWVRTYNGSKIEIPSDSLLELTARSSLYHLLANTRVNNVTVERGLLLPVSGLSADSYGGLVFWDADMWMVPALLPFAPTHAKNVNGFRNATHHQALLNAKQYGYSGAAYPWTSGGFSNCTSTGPCVDYEYHLNVDIAFSTLSIFLSGATSELNDDYLRYTTWPIVKDAADFLTSYVKLNKNTGYYETHNLTDPDEYANNIDNGAFTNAGIKTLLKWATDIGNHLNVSIDSKWMEISNKILIPRAESNITLEYSGMNSSVEIKQADVTLMVYPLNMIKDPINAAYAIRDLYYYSGKQAASGPAMTYPVFVAAAQSLLNCGSSSQSYLYKSVLPYMRMPFAQFSEQSNDNFATNGGTNPAFPFLTANGGFLQSVFFGLTGIRYTYDVDISTNKMSRILKFDPTELSMLPGGMALRKFQYMDNYYDIIIDDSNGTISHKSGNNSIIIKVPNRDRNVDTDIHFHKPKNNTLNPRGENQVRQADDNSGTYYILHPGQELVLPLYKPLLSVEGNLAERRQITNLTEGVAGDVGNSAIDGNNYTHWQPANKDTAKLLIDLGTAKQINHGFIDWGNRPARNFSLSILPHSEILEGLFSNVTYIMETSSGTYDEIRTEVAQYLHNYLGIDGKGNGNGTCSSDVSTILNWKFGSFDNIIKALPNIADLHESFLTILEDENIIPSEPYHSEVYEKGIVTLLQGNLTKFNINYDKVHYNTSLSCLFGASPDGWRKARYVIVSVEGTYDNDTHPYGATINEIVLQN